jgi:LysM repeat protein
VLKKSIFFFLLLLCYTSGVFLSAQESPVIVNRSTIVQRVDGKEYFFHPVLQGQTLFSIARAYGVSQDEILKANPELRPNELRLNQIIRIPVKQQPAVASDKVQSETVKKVVYIEHQVKRRETVYGISRSYNITENELLEHNPTARAGLRPNMMLRIPRYREATIYFKEYVVPPRQTLFSISREFEISIPELEQINPELKEGLKAGQIIRIPIEQTQQVQPPFLHDPQTHEPDPMIDRKPVALDPYCSNPQIKSTYHVALMIPLYLEDLVDEETGTAPVSERSLRYLEYYEGIMIALDSVRARGADIRLSVYDVCESEVKARRAIWRPEMAQMDLIIGPFDKKVFPLVAGFAKEKNIPIVSPFHADERDLLRRYPSMFQVTPDLETQMKYMASFVSANYPEDNIIVVHNNQPGIINLISMYKKTLNDGLNYYRFQKDSANMAKIGGYFLNGVYVGERISNVYVINDSLRQSQRAHGNISGVDRSRYMNRENLSEVVYSRDGMEKLREKFDTTRKNVIVTLMGGEANIANFTRQLYNLRDTFNLVVFGVPQWREYRSLDFNYLQSLNTHIFTPEFIDYNDVANLNYIRRFRSINHVEPEWMGFRAVETGVFFFTALMQYGSEFYRCIDFMNQHNTHNSPFLFEKPYEEGGWENNFVFIFRHENYMVKDVRESRRRGISQTR